MPDKVSAQNRGITSDERIRNVLRRHIKRAYDRHDFTRQQLADESGVELHHIDAIISTDTAKHRRVATEDAMNLAYTLGDAAVSALAGCIHYRATRAGENDIVPAQMVAGVLPHISTIATAAADGRFDHTELPACRVAARRQFGVIVTPISSAGAKSN